MAMNTALIDFTLPPHGFPPTAMTGAELDDTWNTLAKEMTDFSCVLSIKAEHFNTLDDGAKAYIAYQMSVYLKNKWDISSAVMYVKDGYSLERYFLGPLSEFTNGNRMLLYIAGRLPIYVSRKPTTYLEDRNQDLSCLPTAAEAGFQPQYKTEEAKCEVAQKKIPRPPNAYILYRRDHHQYVKQQCPGITNNEISRVLGNSWHNETEETRARYKILAEELKQKLLTVCPDYQYKPRKSTEIRKRRRITQPVHASTIAGGGDIKDESAYPGQPTGIGTAEGEASATNLTNTWAPDGLVNMSQH